MFRNITVSNLTIADDVRHALAEDIGDGDVTARLIPIDQQAHASVISRETAVICGTLWFDEVFRQLDSTGVKIEWRVHDGERVQANQILCILQGSARSLLTGERTALNFLQLLSGVSTRCQHFADFVQGTHVRLHDTRKTLPGLRLAQKYAVTQGGCHSHRWGLYDAFLIKENHIAACDGSVEKAVQRAHECAPGKPVEIEVENLVELQQALNAKADVILLDNMSLDEMRQAVQITNHQAELEASGGIDETTLRAVAETGVDYIAIGTLTKDIKAIDLSMRFSSS